MAANCFASLAKMAPGRVTFGVGTGFMGRNTMGLPAQRLGDMAAYVDVVQRMLWGETVDWAVEGATRAIRFLNPEAGMIALEDVPVHISAFGPKGRALTAAKADGWVTFMGPTESAIHQAPEIDAACRVAGREPASLYRTVFTLGCVLGDREDPGSERAMAQAGPGSAVQWHGMMERWADLPPAAQKMAGAYRRLYESYQPEHGRYLALHAGHLIHVREDERRFVTGEMIRASSFTADRHDADGLSNGQPKNAIADGPAAPAAGDHHKCRA